jgi:hypothetical protein
VERGRKQRGRTQRVGVWDDDRFRSARIGLASAAGLLVLGAFLPWASIDAPNARSFTLSSLDRSSDGWVTLASGLIVLGLAAMRAGRGTFAIAGLAGLVASATAVENWLRLRDLVERVENVTPAPVEGLIGVGLWLTLAGAIAIVAVSAWGLGSAWYDARGLQVQRVG